MHKYTAAVAVASILAAGAVGTAYLWPGQGRPHRASQEPISQAQIRNHLRGLVPRFYPSVLSDGSVCRVARQAGDYGAQLRQQGAPEPITVVPDLSGKAIPEKAENVMLAVAAESAIIGWLYAEKQQSQDPTQVRIDAALLAYGDCRD